jgi:hypothetical protein
MVEAASTGMRRLLLLHSGAHVDQEVIDRV